jgi:hypothetical protein
MRRRSRGAILWCRKPLDEPSRLAALILDFLGERVVGSA